jgi:hypothetical protein
MNDRNKRLPYIQASHQQNEAPARFTLEMPTSSRATWTRPVATCPQNRSIRRVIERALDA